jgi:hypothetical protein
LKPSNFDQIYCSVCINLLIRHEEEPLPASLVVDQLWLRIWRDYYSLLFDYFLQLHLQMILLFYPYYEHPFEQELFIIFLLLRRCCGLLIIIVIVIIIVVVVITTVIFFVVIAIVVVIISWLLNRLIVLIFLT